MKLKDLYFFCVWIFIFFGSYKIWYSFFIQKVYRLREDEFQSMYDFLIMTYADSIRSWLAKRLKLRLYYNSKLFIIFLRLIGFAGTALGIVGFIFYFYVKSTEFGYIWEVIL